MVKKKSARAASQSEIVHMESILLNIAFIQDRAMLFQLEGGGVQIRSRDVARI